MSTFVTHYDPEAFTVVHPLDDQPEQKCSGDSLGPLKMSGSVRTSLIILRGYLIAMVGLVAYRLLEVTVFTHH